MDSIISTFHIDWKIMTAQLINFAVVFVVLYYFALRPLKKIMSSRTQKIERGLEDAKSGAQALQKAQDESKQLLTQARKERQSMMEQIKQDSALSGKKIIEEARLEAEKLISQAKQQMDLEKTMIIKEAKIEIAELISLGVSKVVGSAINETVDRKFIDKISNKNDKD